MAPKQLNLFLSASIPLQNRHEKYWQTADNIAIRDSVLALASVALPRFKLIWGGHPSITPLIAQVLKHIKVNVPGSVTLYQSRHFEQSFPAENKDVPRIIKTTDLGDIASSLAEMRNRMLNDNEFHAGIFIGGMEGVEEEYALFREKHPQAKVFPIASTGAAAKIIYDRDWNHQQPKLLTNLAYASLFKDLLNL